jgi:endonuclease YncB( thermonuclease family)
VLWHFDLRSGRRHASAQSVRHSRRAGRAEYRDAGGARPRRSVVRRRGVRGHPAREFRRYLGNREVACEPAGGGNDYRCRVDDQDLSRVMQFNGGGRASVNATADLRALEQQARSSRVGIWGGRNEKDDQAFPYQLQR